MERQTQSGITAYASGGQSGAAQCYAKNCRVDAVLTNGASVRAKRAVEGAVQNISNNTGSYNMDLFPELGDKFQGLSINIAISIAFGNIIRMVCYTDGEWTTI